MGAPKFRTVADELLPAALAAHQQLGDRGYRVRFEVPDHAAPFTPTLSATRSSTALHLDVVGHIDLERVREWVAFARSSARDTRFALCVPDTTSIPSQTLADIRSLGVGLFSSDGTNLVETIAPVDLALNVQLPALAKLPRKVKELLGPAYEKFDRGEWREGFEEASNALEEEAKRYLKRWTRTGRIRLRSRSGPRQPPVSEIDKLTMGGLCDRFALILTPTLLDTMIENALRQINPDRIGRVHKRRAKRTETRLRRNVGTHMWLIVNVMRRMAE